MAWPSKKFPAEGSAISLRSGHDMGENAGKTIQRKISATENTDDFFAAELILYLQRAREGHRACTLRQQLRFLREHSDCFVDVVVGYQ
jgi:hypothetical protein